jgi:hypothetical protein
MSQSLKELETHRDQIQEALSKLGDMRQGSLLERYRKCGKSNCRCAGDDSFAHGPSWSLTRAIKAKTITRIIPVRALERTRRQLAEFQEFRRVSQALVAVNEKICEMRLAEPSADSTEVAKKKDSKRPSTRASLRKSKR